MHALVDLRRRYLGPKYIIGRTCICGWMHALIDIRRGYVGPTYLIRRTSGCIHALVGISLGRRFRLQIILTILKVQCIQVFILNNW